MSYWCNICAVDIAHSCDHQCPKCKVNGVEPDQRLCGPCIAGLRMLHEADQWMGKVRS